MKICKYFILFLLFVSCKSNSVFSDKIDKFFQSKRYKETVKDRNSLFAANQLLKKDTAELGRELRKVKDEYYQLKNEHSNLQKEYVRLEIDHQKLRREFNELLNKSGKQLSQLNQDLMAKSRELDRKEKLLLDREQRIKEMEAVISKQDSITRELNAIVKSALLGFNADELSVEMKNGKVYVSMTDKLLFRSGSANVEEKGKLAIKKLAEVLNRNIDIDIAIEGHTDNVPIKTSLYKDNWDLSVARATNIVRMLHSDYRVNPKRLTASGKGEYFPVAPNEDQEGRAKNRRTEIILSPKLDELFKMIDKSLYN